MKATFLAVAITVVGFLSSSALSNAKAQATSFTDIAVTLVDQAGNEISGTLDVTKFVKQGQDITALARLTAAGVTRTVKVPITINQASCTILDLNIGAIDLNLLGLRVQLAPVDLLITAEPAGGLLGVLLCAVANLLNLGNIVGVIQQLNAILALLG
ncbi:MAG TPA: hypothetical protein VM012_02550 [Flavitalea sp.]|nr:hypothetical protein [Flavitalea sp.]